MSTNIKIAKVNSPEDKEMRKAYSQNTYRACRI